jgi:hypothetical protein
MNRTEWERERTKGRARFIWKHGVLKCGLPGGVALALAIYGTAHGLSWTGLVSAPFLNELVWKLGLFTPLLGYACGRSFWAYYERTYGAS